MSAGVPPAVPVRRRRIGLWWLLALPTLLLLMVGGGAWWAGSDGSLSRALRIVQGWLPEGQSLEFSDVEGSVARGGRIGRLVWSRPGLTLTIEDLRLVWSLREAFGRDLRVRELYARNVHLRQAPLSEPPPDKPFVMPAQLALPVRVTAPLAIGRVQIERVDEAGVASLQEIHAIAAGYRYNGTWHALRVESLRYGQSTVQASALLHAHALSLSTQLDAVLRGFVEGTGLAMQVQLRANGSLAGGDAAQLEVQLAASDAAAASAQLDARAILHPWRSQPVQQLELTASGLNAQAFHASAPVTSLQGRASVLPDADRDAAAWNAIIDFTNTVPGAWDAQHLPMRQLAATVSLTLEQIDIGNAQIELAGTRAAGTVTLAGAIPLQAPLQSSLQLEVRQLDLQALVTSQPRTDLNGTVSLTPAQQGSWQLQAGLRNALPGPLDRERLPLERLVAVVNGTPERIRAEALELHIGAGRLHMEADYAPPTRTLAVQGELQRLPLRRIHQKMARDASALLSGTFGIDGNTQQELAFEADLASSVTAGADPASQGQWEIRALQTAGTWSPTRLTVHRVDLDAFQARVEGTGIDITLPGFDSIEAHLSGTAPGLQLAADAEMRQQSGGGTLKVQLDSAGQLMAWMKDLPLIGERVPDWRAEGGARIDAQWQGGWRQWQAALRSPSSQQRLSVNATAQTTGLLIELPATRGESGNRIEVRKFNLDVAGNLAAATLDLDADVRANQTVAVLDVRLQSTQQRGRGGAARWNVGFEKFAATANLLEQQQPWSLSISDGLQASFQTGPDTELQLTAGTATITAPPAVAAGDVPLQISWEPMLWRRTSRGAMTVQSTGTITGIQPGWLDVVLARDGEGPLTANGMRTDLVLSGDWDVQMTDRVNLRAHLERESGDVWLDEGTVAAGVTAFEVTVRSAEQDVQLAVRGETQRGGFLAAELGTTLQRQDDGWHVPHGAPLSGSIEARVRDMSTWTFFAPPGWRIGGAVSATIQLAGTVQAPRLDGRVEGSQLMLRSVLDGVELVNGALRAELAGTRLAITELTFEGGTGSRAHVRGFSGNLTPPPTARGRMTASGSIDWSGAATATEAASGIAMNLEAGLERMQVLVRNDRQMSLSGEMSARLADGQLTVRGDMRVDRAAIVLPEASAPTIGNDVVILREADLRNPSAAEARQRGQLQPRKPIDLEVQLDLGRDLALEGQGITTRLEGALTVRSNSRGSDPFSLFGEVRTVEGRYRAWGQALDVETGVVRFNGPMMNPALELLAIRPDIDVRAGVRVTGTLLAPRVQLFSDPVLPEGEMLSWVVLGRPTLVTGGEGTNMQQAALSLAAGQLAGGLGRGLGLDELGLNEGAVTIGKRITNELYLTYEAGFSGAASALYIFYDITRRLTVRGQTGEASAVDLIYTIKYD